MQEVKKPRKPLIYYYVIVLLILLLFNFLFMPWAAKQNNSAPVQKITIVPRTMGALGYTMQRPEEEKYLNSKDEMLADLVAFFGGRAAEEVKFNSITTGASNDIERATSIAREIGRAHV